MFWTFSRQTLLSKNEAQNIVWFFELIFGRSPIVSFSDKTCLTVSGPDSNQTCIFPFTYSGKRHEECTDEGHDQFWCQTELPDNTTDLTDYTNTVKWGNCGPDCKIEGKYSQLNFLFQKISHSSHTDRFQVEMCHNYNFKE